MTISGLSVSGPDAANYDFTIPASVLADILRRSVTVRANDAQKTQDTPDPEFTYALVSGSLVGGDSLSGALAREAGEGAGFYDILRGSLSLSENYQVNYETWNAPYRCWRLRPGQSPERPEVGRTWRPHGRN